MSSSHFLMLFSVQVLGLGPKATPKDRNVSLCLGVLLKSKRAFSEGSHHMPTAHYLSSVRTLAGDASLLEKSSLDSCLTSFKGDSLIKQI